MSIKFGVTLFPTEYTIGPVQLATALEERGFESFWMPEHSHIPASRISPWPGRTGLAHFLSRGDGSVRRSRCGCGRYEKPQTRHRNLLGG